MLGELITNGLVLAFGYAYPALECFRTVEKFRVDIEELRFWCQYWIIVAVITVFERVGDMFISWLPMYSEAKLALFIYMWYPKTKGCEYVYENMLRPLVWNHETDIERFLKEFKARVMDLAIYYWHNYTELGQSKFFELLQRISSPSANTTRPNSQDDPNPRADVVTPSAPPFPDPPSTPSGLFRRNRQPSSGRPPVPPRNSTGRRIVTQSPKSELVQVHLDGHTEFIHEEMITYDDYSGPGPNDSPQKISADQKSHTAWFRFGRSRPHR